MKPYRINHIGPLFFDWVNHEVRVTNLKIGYGIRVFTNGHLSCESLVPDRIDIGPQIHEMLRMEFKMGNWSDMADRSRFRFFEKENRAKNEK